MIKPKIDFLKQNPQFQIRVLQLAKDNRRHRIYTNAT